MPLEFQTLLDCGLETAARTVTLGFTDYFVPIQITPAGLMQMVRQDSVDLGLSRLVLRDGEPAAAALMARRGWTSRLAGMAVVPAARGSGVGKACMERLLAEARERGDHSMTLEVIQNNTPALRLYEKCGFHILRGLAGFAAQAGTAVPDGAAVEDSEPLEAVDLRSVAAALTAHGPADLPWQLSAETLAQAGPPALAYRRGAAMIALSSPAAPTVYVRALVTEPSARRRGLASGLLRAVMARFPGKAWRVPAIWPQELGGLFEKVGWQKEELAQWQMMINFEDSNDAHL
jgi:ribosomal protein S18 acetylase RimI-like enzyme